MDFLGFQKRLYRLLYMSFKVKSKGGELLLVFEFFSFSRFPSQITAFHFFYRTKQNHVPKKFNTFFVLTVEMKNTVLLVNMIEGAGWRINPGKVYQKIFESNYILLNEDN